MLHNFENLLEINKSICNHYKITKTFINSNIYIFYKFSKIPREFGKVKAILTMLAALKWPCKMLG